MGAGMNFVAAFDDPEVFGPFFAGKSWDTWRAVLKAAHGVPLNAEELKLFRSVADRDPPRARVRELWIIAGRRAGKDSVASAMAAFASLQPYSGLRPGETPAVMCLANDRQQAKIVLRYVRGYFEQVESLQGIVERETSDSLELSNGVEIVVMTNSLRAVRGRTVAFACLDEVAFYREDLSASPDTELYNALMPGMATIPDAMLVGISSPYRKAGLLFQKYKDHYSKPDESVLVVRGPSRVFNPMLLQSIVDDAMEKDPAAARAEYLGEFRDDISGFLSRELVEAAVDYGVTVRPPVRGVQYRAFADPSGGAHDSFTAAIAHKEGDVAILDCLIEVVAPFNSSQATAMITATFKQYGCTVCVGDAYGKNWVVDAFAERGVRYVQSELARSEIYLESAPAFTSARVQLLDNNRLVHQLCNLERRTSPGGRDRIDHPGGGADDLANSACGVLGLVRSGVVTSLNVSRDTAATFGAAMARIGRRAGIRPSSFGGFPRPSVSMNDPVNYRPVGGNAPSSSGADGGTLISWGED
jgi:hypothetical protein